MSVSHVPQAVAWHRHQHLYGLRGYPLALAVTALATGIGLGLSNGLGQQAIGLLPFPLAVLTAAWLWGMGPGLVAATGSALAVTFFFLDPIGSLAIHSAQEGTALIVFVLASIIESTVVGASRRSESGLTRMAQAIAVSEQKYRILFERNPEPLLIFDARTRAVIAANESALTTFGYGADEVQGLRIGVLFDADDEERFLANVDGRDRRTWRLVTKLGDRLDVETRCAPAPWVGGLVYMMAVRDMTSRVRSERELLEANEELQRAKKAAERVTKARDRFLAALSHELRTPLTPALLASAALERRASLPEDVRRKLGLIRAKVTLEATLIDAVLDIARIVSGDFKLETKPTEVTHIVVGAVDACEPDAGARKIEVRRDFAATECIARVDADRLQRAIESVVYRAIEAAPAASVVRVWTSHGATDWISIGVHHDGEVADTAAMFDPFERGAIPEAPSAWGLGLRLAIGKAVFEACGGSVEATSGKEGTCVVMRLPTVPSSEQPTS